MKTAVIAIDSWKLPTFKRHLDKAGYGYTEHPGLTKDTLLLKVRTPQMPQPGGALHTVVAAANQECANERTKT